MFQIHAAELRSITSICVVEDASKCPLGYTPIVRTHDQEADADLWKDGWIGRRVTRYLCVSKTQGRPEHIIQSVQILQDKELPPEGFSVIQQTTDTSQKAFKKKLLCFKHAHFKVNVESVVDVIVLNKLKNPPDGYEHIGDINGMHFMIRKISALTRLSTTAAPPTLAYGASPVYPSLHDSFSNININTNNGLANKLPSANLPPYPSSAPNSPAHQNSYYPNQVNRNYPTNTATLSSVIGADGIPFVLRDNLMPKGMANNLGGRRVSLGVQVKSANDIEREYDYDFKMERDVIMNGGSM